MSLYGKIEAWLNANYRADKRLFHICHFSQGESPTSTSMDVPQGGKKRGTEVDDEVSNLPELFVCHFYKSVPRKKQD